MWGYNGCGQLGDDTTEDKYTPTKITIPAPTPANYLSSRASSSVSSLIPNETYNFYAMTDHAAEDALSRPNLLYITQAVADENGRLSVPYSNANAVTFLKRMGITDISGAEMTVPLLTECGKTLYPVPAVTYDGETLVEGRDYEIISDGASAAGKHTVTVAGIGDYNGTLSAEFTIAPKIKPSAEAGDGSVTLSWNAVSGASEYAVAYCVGNGDFFLDGFTDKTSYTVSNLTNGEKYGFTVLSRINGEWTTFVKTDAVSAIPGANASGASVGGRFKSYVGKNAKSNELTIRLMQGGDVMYEFVSDDKEGDWSIDGVEAGDYTLVVSKSKHAPREYALTVGNSDIPLDVEILLYGDVTKDGEIDAKDATQILRFASKLDSTLSLGTAENQAYMLTVGNVLRKNDDPSAQDATQILRYASKITSVIDLID